MKEGGFLISVQQQSKATALRIRAFSRLGEEDLAEPTSQTGWAIGPIAGYTAATLPLLGQTRAVLAAAVAADRAAGATWNEIAAVLDTSADTAARRYRPN